MKEANEDDTEAAGLSSPPVGDIEEMKEDNNILSKWFDIMKNRIEAINQYVRDDQEGLDPCDWKLLKERAIRPYDYFKQDQIGDGITPRQFKTIAKHIATENGKAEFVKWAAQHDDINLAQGTPIDTIATLTKDEASEFIGDKIFR